MVSFPLSVSTLAFKSHSPGVVPGPLFSVICSFRLFLAVMRERPTSFYHAPLRFGKLEVCPPSFAELACHTCLLTLATVAGVLLSLSQCVAGSLCESSEAAEQVALRPQGG